jgi:hypothetical protein
LQALEGFGIISPESTGFRGEDAMASPFKFSKYGQSGIEVSEVFSAIAGHVDDLAVIRSMQTDIPAHDVATVMMNTGSLRTAKPSVGAWALYGLGSANENMPGYISLRPNGASPPSGSLNWARRRSRIRSSRRASSRSKWPIGWKSRPATPSICRRSRRSVRTLYGDTPQGKQLMIARRLVERGVRFVQVWAGWQEYAHALLLTNEAAFVN